MVTHAKVSARRSSASAATLAFTALTIVCLAAPSAQASVTYQLTDLNSTADFNLGAPDPSMESGLINWTVDGADHMWGNWFAYRVGNNAEQWIDTLTLDWVGTSNGNGNAGEDRLVADFLDPSGDFMITLDYTLNGGPLGSDASDIGLLVKVTNLTNEALPFSLYEYMDLDVAGHFSDNTAEVLNANTVRQSNALAQVETVMTPSPDLWEVNSWPATRDKINNGTMDDLDGTVGPLTGDVTWASQWNTLIAPGDVYHVSQDTRIISVTPEPASMGLLALGMGALLRRRKR